MKNILVLMHDDSGQESRFQAALDLTRGLEGHLRCVDIAMVPEFIGVYAEMGGSAALMADEQARELANRQRMEARLRIEDIPYDWIDDTGFASSCLRDATALADLVVLNREFDDIAYPDMRKLVGDTIVKTGKPIVAVPSTARGFNLYGHALVAWDGSRQAEAALQAAVPLLKHAGTVTILVVDDGSLRTPPVDAAEYLSRHGIRPILSIEPARDIASAVILDEVRRQRGDYLVMGGFGHSRFIEAAFGGVTRKMLGECAVPLFLAH
jgi:nucleotide-binding universal stress UspA family protein